MRSRITCAALTALLFGGCIPKEDGHAICTRQVVGSELGPTEISAFLMIPDSKIEGGEISNYGILVFSDSCVQNLRVNMSDETIKYLIDSAKELKVYIDPPGEKLANATLKIDRVRVKSGVIANYVTGVSNLADAKRLPKPLTAGKLFWIRKGS